MKIKPIRRFRLLTPSQNKKRPEDNDGPDLNAWRSAINEGSRHVWAQYLTYILFSIYFVINLASTNDEQLLVDGPVSIPLLNVTVPTFYFYIVAPIIFFILHLNLVMKFYLLSRKLRNCKNQLEKSCAPSGEYERDLIFPFQFNFILLSPAGDRNLMLKIMGFGFWMTIFVIPLTIQLWTILAFMPYHSTIVTVIHQILMLANFLFLSLILPLILRGEPYWRKPPEEGELSIFLKIISYPASMIAYFGNGWTVNPADNWRTNFIISPSVSRIFLTLTSCVSAIIVLAAAAVYPHHPNLDIEGHISPDSVLNKLLHKNLSVPGKDIYVRPPAPEALADYLEEKMDLDKFKHFLKPIDLSGRDLRSADLSGSNMIGAIMTRCDLSSSNLFRARLDGADIRYSHLNGSSIQESVLNGVDISDSNLKGIDLRSSSLMGSILSDSDLTGANLVGTYMQGADLEKANLKGASLIAAKLGGADLDEADLTGVSLESADLIGATLKGANLFGARLFDTNLHKADFENADLRLSDFREVDFQGSLSYTYFDDLQRMVNRFAPKDNQLEPYRFFYLDKTNFEGSDLDKAIYDSKGYFRNMPKLQIDDYREQIIPLLIELSCEDPKVAENIFKDRISGLRPIVEQPKKFSQLIIKENCKAIQENERLFETYKYLANSSVQEYPVVIWIYTSPRNHKKVNCPANEANYSWCK